MGTWGTNILQNDEAMDLYGQFEDLFYERKELGAIKASIQQSYGLFDKNKQAVLEDNTNRWLAYALICWECQALDKETLELVDLILEQEIDADNWEELWGKRKKEVEKFRKKIAVPSKKMKTIPRFFTLVPPFEMGDCLTFKFEDGMYGAAICTAIVRDHKKPAYHGWHFAWIKWHGPDKPTLKDFYNGHFLVHRYASSNPPYYNKLEDSMHYSFTGTIRDLEEYKELKAEMDGLEVIGKLTMKEAIRARGGNMCFELGRWKLEDVQDPEQLSKEYPVKNYANYSDNPD